MALQDLFRSNYDNILEIARENLNFCNELTDSNLYAAYIIGKVGDESDIPNLMRLYFWIEESMMVQKFSKMSTIMPKKNIMDAIELIKARNR